jgi:thiol:disulfide interchange protein DsbC
MIRRRIGILVLLSALLPLISWASETDIKKAIETFLDGTKVDEVRKLPDLGLYEVRLGNDVVYTDEKATFIMSGNLIDIKTRKNLTQARQREISAIKFADLPLDLAIKTVRGKGTRVLATFEDPNCGYCKQLQKEIAKVDDVTIYTFLIPILSPDSDTKARAIWCSADRSKAWRELMVNNKSPAPAPTNCSAPNEKVKALGQKYRIQGTPTIFLANGERIPGYVPAARLEEMLKVASASK